jgi:hypothetical protein
MFIYVFCMIVRIKSIFSLTDIYNGTAVCLFSGDQPASGVRTNCLLINFINSGLVPYKSAFMNTSIGHLFHKLQIE